MICKRCKKRETMPNDPFCVMCDEMLFEARIDAQEKNQEPEWENIGIEEEQS